MLCWKISYSVFLIILTGCLSCFLTSCKSSGRGSIVKRQIQTPTEVVNYLPNEVAVKYLQTLSKKNPDKYKEWACGSFSNDWIEAVKINKGLFSNKFEKVHLNYSNAYFRTHTQLTESTPSTTIIIDNQNNNIFCHLGHSVDELKKINAALLSLGIQRRTDW